MEDALVATVAALVVMAVLTEVLATVSKSSRVHITLSVPATVMDLCKRKAFDLFDLNFQRFHTLKILTKPPSQGPTQFLCKSPNVASLSIVLPPTTTRRATVQLNSPTAAAPKHLRASNLSESRRHPCAHQSVNPLATLLDPLMALAPHKESAAREMAIDQPRPMATQAKEHLIPEGARSDLLSNEAEALTSKGATDLPVVRAVRVMAAEEALLFQVSAKVPNVDTTTTGSDLLMVDRTCLTVDPMVEATES